MLATQEFHRRDTLGHRLNAFAPVSRDDARKSCIEAPPPAPQTGFQLHTADGTYRYLTAGERDAFLREADLAGRPVRTLCVTLKRGRGVIPSAKVQILLSS
jgi:hypothetical protein